MKRRLFAMIACTCLVMQLPAQAITLTYSDKTQKVAPYFDFRGSYDLPFNLNVNGFLGIAPDLSSFISPLPPSATRSGSDLPSQIASQIKWDSLLDLNLNLGYKFKLFDVIGFSGTLMPYLGYRHMFTFTGDLNNNSTNTQAQGMHYGARFLLGLPLGFSGFAYAEASTLLGGSFDQGSTHSAMNTHNVTLPGFGLGLNWQLPILNLASAYAGYKGFFLPTDLRLDNNLDSGISLVHGIDFGVNFLFFGI